MKRVKLKTGLTCIENRKDNGTISIVVQDKVTIFQNLKYHFNRLIK